MPPSHLTLAKGRTTRPAGRPSYGFWLAVRGTEVPDGIERQGTADYVACQVQPSGFQGPNPGTPPSRGVGPSCALHVGRRVLGLRLPARRLLQREALGKLRHGFQLAGLVAGSLACRGRGWYRPRPNPSPGLQTACLPSEEALSLKVGS